MRGRSTSSVGKHFEYSTSSSSVCMIPSAGASSTFVLRNDHFEGLFSFAAASFLALFFCRAAWAAAADILLAGYGLGSRGAALAGYWLYGLGCCLGARDGQPRCYARADRRRVAESCLDAAAGSFEGLSRRRQTTSSRRRRKYPGFLVRAGLKRKCGPSWGPARAAMPTASTVSSSAPRGPPKRKNGKHPAARGRRQRRCVRLLVEAGADPRRGTTRGAARDAEERRPVTAGSTASAA